MQASNTPRGCKRNIMYKNDVDTAQFVRFEDVQVTRRSGKTTTKRLKVAVDVEKAESGEWSKIEGVQSMSHQLEEYVANGLDFTNEMPILAKPWKVKWSVKMTRDRIDRFIRLKKTIYYNLWKGWMVCWKLCWVRKLAKIPDEMLALYK